MSKLIKIFSGSNGLDTKSDPVRIKFDPETGTAALAACVNVDCSDDGRVSRRKGFAATSRTEAWGNLFGCGSYGLGTKGDALCVIEPDMSYTAIRNITVGAKVSYSRDTDGKQDIIYYANGYEQGKIVNKLSYTWTAGEYVGATSRKELYNPPIGHLLEIRNLRMFIAEGNILWYSEPGSLSQFCLAANFFGFPSRIKMIIALDAGLLVSDSESLYFLQGEIAPSINEMPKQIKLTDYPAIEGSCVKIPGSRFGEGVPGVGVIFTSTAGICFCSNTGEFKNISERKVDIPSGISGASLYRDGNFITIIN